MSDSIDILMQFINDNSIGLTIYMTRNKDKTLIRVKENFSQNYADECCNRNLHEELAIQKKLIEKVRARQCRTLRT